MTGTLCPCCGERGRPHQKSTKLCPWCYDECTNEGCTRPGEIMTDEPRRTTEPHDRLTRICAAMTDTFDAHPEHQPDDKCIVFLDCDQRGGIGIHGYDDDTEAIAALFVHLQAMFRAHGKDLQFMAVPDDVSGITDG